MIPPKSGPPDMSHLLPASMRGGEGSESVRRRRLREDPEALAEGVGEGVSTASAALKAERYVPKIFGFKVNEVAKLQRWQEAVRDRCATYSMLLAIRLLMAFSDKWRDWRS